jgi:beta-alanine degradation protein BauB
MPSGAVPRLAIVKATSIVQVENDRVVVTEWRFAPGADTGHHVHRHDYVVVPLTSGTLKLEEANGTRSVQLEIGASYARPAGVRHNVINEGPQHVTVHGRDEVVVITADEFRRLKGQVTGKALVAAMQASPHREVELAPERFPLPVRGVSL